MSKGIQTAADILVTATSISFEQAIKLIDFLIDAINYSLIRNRQLPDFAEVILAFLNRDIVFYFPELKVKDLTISMIFAMLNATPKEVPEYIKNYEKEGEIPYLNSTELMRFDLIFEVTNKELYDSM